ncbi:hypothetical protein HDU96_002638 [Phlyctochytrium bullatum]|nr:hypothetical protein HDU96_002638 [Phlyctochytrium bullatum]
MLSTIPESIGTRENPLVLKPIAPKWKPDAPPVYSLKGGRLFFVNRDTAIKELHFIHETKFERAKTNTGAEWLIPLADNALGLGKSEFASHYILKSREMWPEASRDGFQRTLCACHTVIINFDEGALADGDFESVLLRHLVDALRDRFESSPSFLFEKWDTVKEFLEQLTAVAGPVFIVLDEIGAAFYRKELDIFQQREMFVLFCRRMLAKWMKLENVFFVVLGASSFLKYIGGRPTNVNLPHSSFDVERLSIHLLRQDPIKKILTSTPVSSTTDVTIASNLGLDETRVEHAAKHLFEQTYGNPREILKALQKCRTYEDILSYVDPLRPKNFEKVYERLYREHRVLIDLLAKARRKERVDLTKPREDAGRRTARLVDVVNNAHIAWDNSMDDADLYVPPIVQAFLDTFSLPLRRFIALLGDTLSRNISLNYPIVFEWIVLKRFQEIFLSPMQPGKAHPKFFNTPLFGQCESVLFYPEILPFPKISERGREKPDLNSATASVESWPALLNLIEDLDKPVSFKPAPMSASPDAFLMCDAYRGSRPVALTVGLAVKNYSGSNLSHNHIDRECHVFNRMFTDVDPKSRINVLFICCPQYTKAIQNKFRDSLYFQVFDHDSRKYPHINEVVLLDLSDQNRRKGFLQLRDEESDIVEQIITKRELEYGIPR